MPDEVVARARELLEASRSPEVASDDVTVVRSAIAAGVDVLITGDRDLLEAHLPIRVPSPRAFWELLRGQPPSDEIHER